MEITGLGLFQWMPNNAHHKNFNESKLIPVKYCYYVCVQQVQNKPTVFLVMSANVISEH